MEADSVTSWIRARVYQLEDERPNRIVYHQAQFLAPSFFYLIDRFRERVCHLFQLITDRRN